MGESDPIDRPEPDPADAADGVSSDEVKAGPRLALISAVAPTPPAGTSTLPSEQLARLADRAAAALALPTPAVDAERTLPPEALARVLDAVEASTAAATKKAYRSDWGPVRRLGRRRGFPPLPAPPAVLAHYVTEAPPSRPASGVAVRPPPIWRPRSRTARTALRGSAPWEIRRRSTGRWRR